jgi:hypothetical protein
MKPGSLCWALPVLFLTLAVSASPVAADGWDHMIAPYIWGTGLDGTIGIGPVETSVDLSFGDILENLDGGVLIHYEGSKGDWTILSDLVFTDVGTDGNLIHTDYKQTIFEIGAGYALKPSFEVLFGARWNDNDAEILVLRPGGGVQTRAVGRVSWTDPFVGGRWTAELAEKWALRTRLDVGGFGLGSDLTWNASLTTLYQATEKISLGFGYRVMDIDYDDLLRYDVQMPGALLGVGFSF